MHFHIVDGPSFIGANGLPYEMAHFRASHENQGFQRADGTLYFPQIGNEKPFTDSYPADNAAVSF